MLFTCEYHVIVEFIEVIIPLHYGIFMAVLYYLPDAKYYPHMRVLDSEHELLQVVLNILYVVSLELISLIGFCVLVQRKFDISCLYVLAFVLDTHAEMIQMRLLLLVPYIIFMPIEHAGVDYTFKFEWMHQQSNAV
ncbi:hypothetical protein Poli38472_013018 [Pythium oligandrum]|uniref:Uncharacterized protein n=1 Tax=Pythium oligandrum TaxID=41045 RepID=A0A8K1FJ02_PYTOL|nr:hypothetical protein Poli38472_013018 [Pythium oligandrum]|eukprot:TMW64396.1 hypothetical protein Poli38472_013018 [Pythium oligandrum]